MHVNHPMAMLLNIFHMEKNEVCAIHTNLVFETKEHMSKKTRDCG